MRILLIHGGSQTHTLMETRLELLKSAYSKGSNDDLTFSRSNELTDGPFKLALKDASDQAHTHSWLEDDDPTLAINNLSLEWNNAIENNDPYAGILGFSQGAAIAASIASDPNNNFPSLSFVIIRANDPSPSPSSSSSGSGP